MPQVPSSLCGDSLCGCSMADPDASGCGEHGGEIPPTERPCTLMSDHAHGLAELFRAEDADRVVVQAELDAGRARRHAVNRRRPAPRQRRRCVEPGQDVAFWITACYRAA